MNNDKDKEIEKKEQENIKKNWFKNVGFTSKHPTYQLGDSMLENLYENRATGLEESNVRRFGT